MQNANLVLLSENSSDLVFPQVKDFIDGKIKKIKFLKSDQLVYKRKCNIDQQYIIKIDRSSDVIYGLELTGQCNDVIEHINNIELVIGEQIVSVFYLSELYVSENNGIFLIKIDFDRLFLNYNFLPLIGLMYHAVYFRVNGVNMENLNLNGYLVEGLLDNDLRLNCMEMRHDILMKHYERYEMELRGNRIYINYGYGLLSRENFIKLLKFQFDRAVDFNLITIYGNNSILTVLTKNDLTFIGNGFIMEKFYYETFLYNNIIIEFDKKIEGKLTLTTINYNLLVIQSGISGLNYIGLRREITGDNIDIKYRIISEEMYRNKVLPKGDEICAISHEELEGSDIVICGECYTSYRRESIEEWFVRSGEKFCPYGRCGDQIWYKKGL